MWPHGVRLIAQALRGIGERVRDRPSSLEALRKFSQGLATPDQEVGLQRGIAAYLHARAEALAHGCEPLQLERFLNIPTTDVEWMRLHRDDWLRAAFQQMRIAKAKVAAADLHKRWMEFVARGGWRAWRDDGDPPEGTDALHEALFYATKLTRGRDGAGVASLSTVERALRRQN
jgi:hypothetical protein